MAFISELVATSSNETVEVKLSSIITSVQLNHESIKLFGKIVEKHQKEIKVLKSIVKDQGLEIKALKELVAPLFERFSLHPNLNPFFDKVSPNSDAIPSWSNLSRL